VAQQGRIDATKDPFEPYRLVDPAGQPVGAVAAFLGDLQACGRPATTQRAYAMALLRWFRFLWAIDLPWDQATRIEAREFSRWIQIAGKPDRPHWRKDASDPPVTPTLGIEYAPATRAHS